MSIIFFLYLISLQTKFPLVAIFFNPNQIIGPQVKPLNIVNSKLTSSMNFPVFICLEVFLLANLLGGGGSE